MTIVYLINRYSTKVVHDKIPLEAWTRHRWIVEHLRVFGCVAYAHVSKEKRKNLDEKGVNCIFTMYSLELKAYRLYNYSPRRPSFQERFLKISHGMAQLMSLQALQVKYQSLMKKMMLMKNKIKE